MTRAPEGGRVPLATYRVQLNREFTFKRAAKIVPYLADLGIGALYASPSFAAAPGSTHGYDVIDYGALNPELGDATAHDGLIDELRRHGLGHVVDFVPNHMGIAHGLNPWWSDVLENGRGSPYADFFDIDWRPLKPELHGKVLLPILGDHYGAVLERGELRLRLAEGAFTVHYFETPLPVAPPTYPLVLRHHLDRLIDALPSDDEQLLELQSIVTSLERLPGQEERDPVLVAERQREQVIAKRRLAALLQGSVPVREAVEEAVDVFNGHPGEPHSFDLLDRLLAAQSYRLAFWRVAAEEINYRRFFAINELAAIRQEVPEVFGATHALLLRLLAEGKVTGIRIDHPDGLWDPARYFRELQRGYGEAIGASGEEGGEAAPSLYVVAEKILEQGEALPANWAIAGTVGYDFMTAVNGLFVDGANRKAFDDLYARFIGEKVTFGDLVYATKHLTMRTALGSEVNVLAQALDRISEQDRRSRDFTLITLGDALRELIACFPVYRTYLAWDDPAAERDRRSIEVAIAQAKRRNAAIDVSVFDFLRDVLLEPGVDAGEGAETRRLERRHFAMKLQQLTGPVMAKGVEDTAFYRYNRLVPLNEVGGDPAQFGGTVAAFHRQNAERCRRWPHAMLATSTHDTKRSEDARARIDVLSELPREWRAAINRWARLNRRHKTRVAGRPAPDRNVEYLLYQTLLGAWPNEEEGREEPTDFGERIVAYMEKATREAQVHTSWTTPNAEYEEATRRFVRALLDPGQSAAFLADFATLGAKVAHFGSFNALSMQLLKLTSPGVPDIYQGTELWDLSLVDPDNRREVNYGRRSQLLRALRRRRVSPKLVGELVETKEDGRIKLFVTHRALTCRRDRARLFTDGDYLPLPAHGKAQEHVCAFARRVGSLADEIVVVVPRLVVGLCGGELVPPVGADIWGDTRVTVEGGNEGQVYRNVFTGETVRAAGTDLALGEVFGSFPVALLERADVR